jgi:hypothetical protein
MDLDKNKKALLITDIEHGMAVISTIHEKQQAIVHPFKKFLNVSIQVPKKTLVVRPNSGFIP